MNWSPSTKRGGCRRNGRVGLIGLAFWIGSCARSELEPVIDAQSKAPAAASAQQSDSEHAAGPTSVPSPHEVRRYTFEKVAVYPHDPESYTQGLLWHEGFLYESAGLWNQSSLRKVHLDSGEVLRKVPVQLSPPTESLFAEGLALVGDELWQLTWKSGRVLVYGLDDFRERRQHKLMGEGWGLCYDGKRLILSDGSSKLRFFDPDGFRPLGAVQVTLEGSGIDQLNELEFIDGEVWANVWQEDRVLRIDPTTGRVNGVVDFTGLIDIEPDIPAPGLGAQNVLNGIAWDADGQRLFVTGKNWPALFEVRVVEVPQEG